MTAMDILEALGQTQEELLCGCDYVVGAAENREADIPAAGNGDQADAPKLSDKKKRKSRQIRIPLDKAKYRRAAAGLAAAAAVLILVYLGSGVFISRSFDSSGFSGMFSTSTSETADMTTADTAEEEFVLEEAEAVEMEEATAESAVEESGAANTDSEKSAPTAADETVKETEEAETESAQLEALQPGEVYIPGFASSAMSDSEYAEWMELVALVQEEIDATLSQEAYETLPVYRFVQAEEPERLGDYPVITAEEAEALLWQGYYLSSAGFSAADFGSAEVASMELQYLISFETQIYMPYYLFDVVVDGDMVYICCVPAVSSEYLEGTLNAGVAQ